MSQIAHNTKVETPEGPFTIKTVLKSPTAVMTRTDEGKVRFAISKSGAVTDGQAVLKITLEDGKSFRVGPEQVLLKSGMQEVNAANVKAGDELESVFAFPAGYAYKTDAGDEVESTGTIKVRSVEEDGEADLYEIVVERTGRFAFSAGVLGVA